MPALRLPRLPRRAAFPAIAAIQLALMAAAAAPSPLYVVYQHEWGFSAITLTAIFAVYAVALLGALLTVGALSDHLGRRPVIAAGMLLAAAGMVLFATAGGVPQLFAARIVHGLGTGAAIGALGAALIDLQPPRSPGLGARVNSTLPSAGLAVGALGSGLLVQYAPAPTVLVYAVLAALYAAAAGAVVLMPETSPRRPGALASLRPRVAVPGPSRTAFLAAAPVLAATWAIGGFYLSLGASLAASVLHLTSHLAGGLVVAVLTAAGAGAAAVLGARPARPVMAAGSLVLAAGTAVTLAGVETASTALFFTGTAIAGVGFGGGFTGAFRTVAATAGADDRAGLIATLYVLSYLAFSAPAVAAGAATGPAGLPAVTLWYGGAVIVLALAAPVLARKGSACPAAPSAAACAAGATTRG